MDTIETPLYQRASFRWRSPSGLVHAGRLFEMHAVCGVRLGVLGTGWDAVDQETRVSCLNCRNVLMPDSERDERRQFRKELAARQSSPAYVIHTSDGIVHEVETADEMLALVDEHGPEVISVDGLNPES